MPTNDGWKKVEEKNPPPKPKVERNGAQKAGFKQNSRPVEKKNGGETWASMLKQKVDAPPKQEEPKVEPMKMADVETALKQSEPEKPVIVAAKEERPVEAIVEKERLTPGLNLGKFLSQESDVEFNFGSASSIPVAINVESLLGVEVHKIGTAREQNNLKSREEVLSNENRSLQRNLELVKEKNTNLEAQMQADRRRMMDADNKHKDTMSSMEEELNALKGKLKDSSRDREMISHPPPPPPGAHHLPPPQGPGQEPFPAGQMYPMPQFYNPQFYPGYYRGYEMPPPHQQQQQGHHAPPPGGNPPDFDDRGAPQQQQRRPAGGRDDKPPGYGNYAPPFNYPYTGMQPPPQQQQQFQRPQQPPPQQQQQQWRPQ